MRTAFLCISVLRVASGPRVKLAGCKYALNHTVVYSTVCSKVVVSVFVLLFVSLWFVLQGDFFLGLALCYFVLVFSGAFGIVVASFGESIHLHVIVAKR